MFWFFKIPPFTINERATFSAVSGRKFRALTIVDNYTRECPVIEVDTSLGGARVVKVLDRLSETRGLPEVITIDNGPEFAGKALDEWAYRKSVKLNFITPGKRWRMLMPRASTAGSVMNA